MTARRVPSRVHLQLARDEVPAEGTREAVARALDDARVGAVLVPLWPTGESRVARAARRYVMAWDARLIHDNTSYAPAARVAAREPVEGETSADAAPALQRALDAGRRVVALREAAVLSPFARDLDAWLAWSRREGAAWGRLARRDPRFARHLQATDWAGWARHNVLHAARRAGEVVQAMRRPDAEAAWLHLLREAAFTAAALHSKQL